MITAEDLTFVSAPFARVARTILAVYLLSNTQWRSTPVTCQNYFHVIFYTILDEQFQSFFDENVSRQWKKSSWSETILRSTLRRASFQNDAPRRVALPFCRILSSVIKDI